MHPFELTNNLNSGISDARQSSSANPRQIFISNFLRKVDEMGLLEKHSDKKVIEVFRGIKPYSPQEKLAQTIDPTSLLHMHICQDTGVVYFG